MTCNLKRLTFKLKLAADFETVVTGDLAQPSTEVWAAVYNEIGKEDPVILHSISEFWAAMLELAKDRNVLAYFHNLKFDGEFILDYLIRVLGYKQGFVDDKPENGFKKPLELKDQELAYVISDRGMWYSITISVNGHFIQFRDSLKLLPFALRKLGKDFKTKHQKLDMDYVGERYAGCEITPEEQDYIKNDALVLSEALEVAFSCGFNSLTIGSACLSNFKSLYDKNVLSAMFPDLSEYKLNTEIYGSPDLDSYIRKSYKGGWCYLVKGLENKIHHNGVTADVNSLYPSMMHSESGNYYPVGRPQKWLDSESFLRRLDRLDSDEHIYYFVRFKCRFCIKPDMLPTVQLKHNVMYKPTEWLMTSDVWDYERKCYTGKYRIGDTVYDAAPEITMTKTDFILFREHYNIKDLYVYEAVLFGTDIGMFDRYIDHWAKIKQENKGAMRTLAKLALNNLYGKFAQSKDSSFKAAFYSPEDNRLHYKDINQAKRKVLYIPIGSAITSYARNFTIRAAQKNYHGRDQRGFIYADTDSIHCDLSPDELIDVPVHPTAFNHWKLETCWDEAIFVRQKTYIEHVTHEDQVPVEELDPPKKPYYLIKCAGMPERCKKQLDISLQGCADTWKEQNEKEYDKMFPEEQAFIETKRELTDFTSGLCIYGKLLPKKVTGGVVLFPTTFEMR